MERPTGHKSSNLQQTAPINIFLVGIESAKLSNSLGCPADLTAPTPATPTVHLPSPITTPVKCLPATSAHHNTAQCTSGATNKRSYGHRSRNNSSNADGIGSSHTPFGACGRHLPFAVGFITFVLCLSVLLVYMEYRALRHQQFIENINQDYDFLGVEQDNPQFINFIRNYHLRDAVDHHAKTAKTVSNSPTPAMTFVLNLLQGKRNGIFIESGAYGASGSNTSETEWLEKHLGWRGLLIQPDIRHYFEARRHNRTRSRAIHGCLSPAPYLREVNYCQDDNGEGAAAAALLPPMHAVGVAATLDGATAAAQTSSSNGGEVRVHSVQHTGNSLLLLEDAAGRCTRVLCFPLFAIMTAVDWMRVDYLGLESSRGAELQVLETIPFDRVRIDVINVHLGPADMEKQTIKKS